MNSKRLFVSLELPTNLKKKLSRIQASLPRNRFKLQSARQLHVTLAYFQNSSIENEYKLKGYLKELMSFPFQIPLHFNGSFTHRCWTKKTDSNYSYQNELIQKDEQIRLELIPHEQLINLRNQLANFADENKMILANRSIPFSPHVTIAVATADFNNEEINLIEIPKKAYYASALALQEEITQLEYKVITKYELN